MIKEIEETKKLLEHHETNVLKEVDTIAKTLPTQVYTKKQWVRNTVIDKIKMRPLDFILLVREMVNNGLSYARGEYYIYDGKGGLKIEETPIGVRKIISSLGEKKGLTVVVNDGYLRVGDEAIIKVNGGIDTLLVTKGMTHFDDTNSEIVAPYATVTVYQKGKMIVQKVIIVPKSEYEKIISNSSKIAKAYPTMLAGKTIMKRVLKAIPSLIGGYIDDSDYATTDRVADRQNVDMEEEEGEAKNKDENKDDIVKKIYNIYKSTLNKDKKPTTATKPIWDIIEKAKEGKKDKDGKPINNINLLPIKDLKTLLREVENASNR